MSQGPFGKRKPGKKRQRKIRRAVKEWNKKEGKYEGLKDSTMGSNRCSRSGKQATEEPRTEKGQAND